MEVRKVQITGGSTFMVTLPKGWAEKVGLRPGSPLRLAPRGEALILIPEGRAMPTKAILELGDRAGEALAREIIALYIAGFDIIEVRGERIGPDQRRVIREVTRALIGPEIVEESTASVVIHNLLDLEEVSAERTFERIYLISKAMLTDALRALLEHDLELARDVIGRDSEVDRLFLMLSRQLRIALQNILKGDQPRLFDHHAAAKQLERIADHAVKIARVALEAEAAVLQGLREALQRAGSKVLSLLDGATEAFLRLDLEGANRVIDQAEEVQDLLLEVARPFWELELGGAERARAAQALGIIGDSLSRVSDYAANIAEVALNAAAPPLSGGGPLQI